MKTAGNGPFERDSLAKYVFPIHPLFTQIWGFLSLKVQVQYRNKLSELLSYQLF